MNIKGDTPSVGEDTDVLQDTERIKELRSQCALAEASLELHPGNDYWSEHLTQCRNELRLLGALDLPEWMECEEAIA